MKTKADNKSAPTRRVCQHRTVYQQPIVTAGGVYCGQGVFCVHCDALLREFDQPVIGDW